jgi:4-hydroxy-3-methylbut-2-enyl diphosphate reductase
VGIGSGPGNELTFSEGLTIQTNSNSMNTRIIEIDHKSGFCFGVTHAIRKAEQYLAQNPLCTVWATSSTTRWKFNDGGQRAECHRPGNVFHTQKRTVLLRAHGEPPQLSICSRKYITLIDGTCRVVLKLQNGSESFGNNARENKQLVIFGKEGHAEVDGLNGQTGNTAIIVQNETI